MSTSVGKRPRRSGMSMLIILCVALLPLALWGCGGGGGGGSSIGPAELPDASSQDLENRGFQFITGEAFDGALANQDVTLAIEEFAGTDSAPFTLVAAGSLVRGTLTLGSCRFTVAESTFPTGQGPQAGTLISIDSCKIDDGMLMVNDIKASGRCDVISAENASLSISPGQCVVVTGLITEVIPDTSHSLEVSPNEQLVQFTLTHPPESDFNIRVVAPASGGEIPCANGTTSPDVCFVPVVEMMADSTLEATVQAAQGTGRFLLEMTSDALDRTNCTTFDEVEPNDTSMESSLLGQVASSCVSINGDLVTLQGNGEPFGGPVDIVVNPVDSRLFVIDRQRKNVIEVDAVNGNRTVVSGRRTLTTLLTALTYWDRQDTLLTTDLDHLYWLTIDGTATFTGPMDHQSMGLTFDLTGNTLYSISHNDNQLRTIDPQNGATIDNIPIVFAGKVVQGGTGMATHPMTGALWALLNTDQSDGEGPSERELVIIDPTTGTATRIGNARDDFTGLAFDQDGRLFSVAGDGRTAELFTLNPLDATSTFFLALGNGSGGEAIAFNPDDGRLYHASGNYDFVFEVIDLAALSTTAIPTRPGPLGDGPSFLAPTDIAVGSNGTLWVVDSALDAVLSVDPATGARTIVSGVDPETGNSVGSGPNFAEPLGLTVDANGRIWVVDSTLDTTLDAVLSVDPITGVRTIVSGVDFETGDPVGSGPNFGRPRDIAVANGTLWVIDTTLNAVLSVDPITGARTVVSGVDPETGNPVGSGPNFAEPLGLTVDANGGRIWVVDISLDAILSVDLATGARDIVSQGDPEMGLQVGSGPDFSRPRGMEIDATGQLLVVDSFLDAVVRVNPVSGNREILSRGNPFLSETDFHKIRVVTQEELRLAFILTPNNPIRNLNLTVSTEASSLSKSCSTTNFPEACAFKAADGELIIRVVSSTGDSGYRLELIPVAESSRRELIPVDLAVQVSGPASAAVGEAVTYTLTIENADADAANAVTLLAVLTGGMTVTSGSSNCRVNQNPVECNLGSLEGRVATEVQINGRPTQQGTVTIEASVGSNNAETNKANNSSSISTQITLPTSADPGGDTEDDDGVL